MIILLSPSKNFNSQNLRTKINYTQPLLLEYSQKIVTYCRTLTPYQIASMMKINDQLAGLNAVRFSEWEIPFTLKTACQAILAFNGTVYTGLAAQNFSQQDFNFAQHTLRILSGLYGLLRPLDLIMPYRLEMGVKLTHFEWKDLYHFWNLILTKTLKQHLNQYGTDILINLASNEYVKALNLKKLSVNLVQPVFLDKNKNHFTTIVYYTKKARGLMSRFIIKNRLSTIDQLKEFNLSGYSFEKEEKSTKDLKLFFKRTHS